MSIIERPGKEQEAELLAFLDRGFSKTKENGFAVCLPVMWRGTDEAMKKHIVIRRDGVIAAAMGIYPLHVHVGKKELLIATTGNVAVAEEYRRLGLMREMMEETDRELHRIGADAARLGGHRQRYQYSGYDYVGRSDSCYLTKENIEKTGVPHGYTFRPINKDDTEDIRYLRALQMAQPVYVERKEEDFYDVMAAWGNRPYLALDETGKRVGGLSAAPDSRSAAEYYAETPEKAFVMLCSFLTAMDVPGIRFPADPSDTGFLRAAGGICETVTANSATQMRILSWSRFTDAYLAVRGYHEDTRSFVLQVEGGERIRVSCGSCEKTEDPADLTLDRLQAARFLFGFDGPEAVCVLPPEKREFIKSILPIPVWWNGQDRV